MRNNTLADKVLYSTKEIFGESEPYVVEYRLGGKIIIFSEHFIRTAREAMTSGCMAKMSDSEVLLFNKWVEYENKVVVRDITGTDNDVVSTLDAWFIDDLNCTPHPVVNGCYDNTTMHTWVDCPSAQ